MEDGRRTPSCPRCRRLEARNALLCDRLRRLQQRVDELERSAKRPAAPFSKGPPKADPKPPGRKPGPHYGPKAHRPPPAPEQIDETHDAPLPKACPDCGGPVEPDKTVAQFQVEIPRRPIYRRFNVQLGRCRNPACGRHLQGRHPLQTSDALGAAASQLGPLAQAAAVWLNKDAGLSHGKVAGLFGRLFHISLTRGAVSQIILRSARRCRKAYRKAIASVRRGRTAYVDETGWRIGGRPAWLHTMVGRTAAVYVVSPGRSRRPAAGVLGDDYSGVLTHDGLAMYDGFKKALHQQCLAHPLRRCRELERSNPAEAVPFARNIKSVLKDTVALGKIRDAGALSGRRLEFAVGGLECRLDELLAGTKSHPANERLAAHLQRHFADWFTFLRRPGVEPTNWPAEQALRPAVVNRKVWGGNRTASGASAQSVLMTVLRTWYRRGRDALEYLARTLCRPAGLCPAALPG